MASKIKSSNIIKMEDLKELDLDSLNLQTGDILLFHESKFWFSRLVEYFTGSQFSHVAMVIKDPQFTTPPLKGYYIFESGQESTPDSENDRRKFGVQIVPLKEVINSYSGRVYVRRIKCDRNLEFYEKLAKAHSNVHNEPYDTNPIDMFKAITSEYTGWFGSTQKQNEYWCSALMAYVFTQLGFLSTNTPWTLVTPKQFSSTYPSNSTNSLIFENCELDNDSIIHNSEL